MSKIENNLKLFGLENNEIKVYVYLLSNRDIPAYQISTGTGVPRTTVYKTLESLESQGLVSKWTKNSVKHFSAENPKRLEGLIKFKSEVLEEVMPELIGQFNNDSIYPTSKLYIGKEGVKYVFNMLLDKIVREDIKQLYVYSDSELTERFPKFFKEWRIKKDKIGTFTKLIVPYGTPMNEDYASNPARETRIIPEKFSFPGSVSVYGSSVVFSSYKEGELYSILVDSPIVAVAISNLMEYIWQTLE